jgi:hypothetical protein
VPRARRIRKVVAPLYDRRSGVRDFRGAGRPASSSPLGTLFRYALPAAARTAAPTLAPAPTPSHVQTSASAAEKKDNRVS